MNIEKLKKDTVWLKEQFTKNSIDINAIQKRRFRVNYKRI